LKIKFGDPKIIGKYGYERVCNKPPYGAFRTFMQNNPKKQKRLERQQQAAPLNVAPTRPKSASDNRAEFYAWCRLWGKMGLYFDRYPDG
jgi:hypothetical protein